MEYCSEQIEWNTLERVRLETASRLGEGIVM